MHDSSRRRLLSACAAAASLSMVSTAGAAYPEQPIRLVVTWPPGGSADAVGRLLAAALAAGIGQTVFVDNVAGASGTIGNGTFVRAKPDGYSLLLATSTTNAAGPSLYAKLPYHPVTDFAPVALAAVAPSILVVPVQSPYRSVKDLVDAAKARPGKLSYGSGGSGNSGHLSAALFASTLGFEATHIPYKGNAPASVDLIGGQLDFMFDNNPMVMLKAGKLRALASTGEQRAAAFPDVPTFGELGWPAVRLTTWYGLAAPKGTPPAVIDRIYAGLLEGLKKGGTTQRLQELGMEVSTQPPAQFGEFWRAELDRYRELVKLSGAKAE